MSRRRVLTFMAAAMTALVCPVVFRVQPRFVWNASASVPIGLYMLEPSRTPAFGDLVAVLPDRSLGRFMIARQYIGPGVPLLKHVVALPGQQICRSGATVTVDGVAFGEALDHDRIGRPLPVWRGCHTVGIDQIFLMNPAVRDSMDGRYFGPISARFVIGVATPLFTDDTASGHFIWRKAAERAPFDTHLISSNEEEQAYADR